MMKPKKNKTTLTSQKGNFTNKLKKNTSENVLLKTKIINMEQNLNDHEKILKNLIEKVKPTPKTLLDNIKENTKIIESYEIEVAGLKKNLDNLMEENAYYKRTLNNQNQSNELDSDYEKQLLKKKCFELEQILHSKEQLIEEKDNNHKLQMKNLNERIIEFQKLVSRLGDCESELEELNKKYEFKETELKKMKQFYEEKIERLKKTSFEQKKAFTLSYNELFEELAFVKKDLEQINKNSLSTKNHKILNFEERI